MFGAHARGRNQVRKFHDHQGGDETLQAVLIEINGSLPSVGFGDHSHAVAVMLDVLAFWNDFHMSSFISGRKLRRDPSLTAGKRIPRCNATPRAAFRARP